MQTLEQSLVTQFKDLLRPHVRPRRFHAFGIGMPKTGTHSLAAILSRYRACHEPYMEYYMQAIMERTEGKLSDSGIRERLRKIDRRMWLEFNVSYINYFLLELLLEEYPRAKFVLTIRDCYSWLDSILNQLLGRTHGEFMTQFHRWYVDRLSPGSHVDGDRVLAEHGIWPLDLWLRVWEHHNTRMLSLVPADRLLVVRIQGIRDDAHRIAEFLGVPADTLDVSRSHEYQAAAKFNLLSQIDGEYLRERMEARCGDMMRRFFPEIRGLSDVAGYRPQDVAATAGAS